MRRFTLLSLLVALLSVTAFAQKVADLRPWQGTVSAPSTIIKGIARQAQPAASNATRAANELVTPPATATVEKWFTADGSFFIYSDGAFQNYTSYMSNVNVATDGDDIYIQGLSAFFPSSWIKGKINGSTAVFDNGQFIGGDETGMDFIAGSDNGSEPSEAIVLSVPTVSSSPEGSCSFSFGIYSISISSSSFASIGFER